MPATHSCNSPIHGIFETTALSRSLSLTIDQLLIGRQEELRYVIRLFTEYVFTTILEDQDARAGEFKNVINGGRV